MDTITHGIAGALIGKGYFSDRGGRVATVAAVVGSIFPDSDVVMEIFSSDPLAIVRYHRGITHSFFGLPFFAAGLAWLTHWIAKKRGIASPSFSVLWLIYAIGIGSHILLDGMTSFGTRMWAPFSPRRVAWDWIFIIDFSFTAIIFVPQVIAWIHGEREESRRRAATMWALFTLATLGVWGLANSIGFPFLAWVIGIASLIFATLFFLPLRNNWGGQIQRASWCRAGVYVSVAFLVACAMAHHAALARAEEFATRNGIAVERIAAIPLPPSLLHWSGVIRSGDGVYLSAIDLRDRSNPNFRFSADSPPNDFVARAMQLPEVRLYWGFARFPLIHTYTDDGEHVVEFIENRFVAHRKDAPPPFSYRVGFDDAGNLIEEGWEQDGTGIRRMKRIAPAAGGDSPRKDSR